MEYFLPSTNVPKDTDREFFNAVLNGTATENYINDYIQYSLENNRLEELEIFFMVESVVGGGFSGGWGEMENGGKLYVPPHPPKYDNIQLERLKRMANRLAALLKQPQQPNEPTTAQLITDIEQLPQQQQQAIREGIKSQIEAQILVQKAANPDGLNDYLKAELANATAAMQTLIQESQKDGAIMPTISKNFVWNMERAKKLRQYLPPTSTQPTEATPTATATTPANPLLNSPKLQQAINNAVEAGFVGFEDGVYKAKNKSWLVVFASELKAKGITTTQYADIETIFGIDSGGLARKWQKVSNQKNYDKIRNTILPLLADI